MAAKTEEQKEAKHQREAARRLQPGYAEAKNARTAARMSDPETRERKRLKDKERRLRILESPEMLARRKEIDAKFRESEKYKSLKSLYSEKGKAERREIRNKSIQESIGLFTPIATKHCECCGGHYVARMDGARMLSYAYCGVCARKNTFTGKKHKPTERECKECKSIFSGCTGAIYCEPCKDVVSKRIKNKQRRITGNTHKRRARHYGCHYEPINRLIVYRRDKWKCYVCGCMVIESKTWVKNMATLDHIIPMSKGGPHTYDNVKTCCAMCNSIKSDKMIDSVQLNIFISMQ